MTVIKRREGWPTPTAKDANGPWHTTHSPSLNVVCTQWPTPCATDYKGPGKTPRDRLDYAVNGETKSAIYPTPRALSLCGGSGSYAQIKNNPNLTDEEKRALIASAGRGAKYPTPQTDHMGGGEMARKRLRKLQADGVLSAEETRGLMMRTVGRQLNPDWVEWLMFWPVGWTDLETPNIRLVWLDPSIDPADLGVIPRVTNRRDNRPARIKALGNGQFPLSAAVAFHWGFALLQSFERSAK